MSDNELLAVLRWVGARYVEPRKFYEPKMITRTPEQNDKLLGAIVDQYGEADKWVARIHRENGRFRIYIGTDRYSELREMMDVLDADVVSMSGRIRTSWGYLNKLGQETHSTRDHVIPITVVSWMKGAVLVPDPATVDALFHA